MAYTTSQAITAFNNYLGITDADKEIIENTKDRGFIFTLPSGRKAVIFIYPLVHKQDNTKNYFDTRDSGAYERALTWNYAISKGLKYFCFGINDSVDKYQDYVFSLECDELKIEELSGTKGGQRSGPGNQIIIPNDYIPSHPFERIQNRLGVFISAIRKDALLDYIEKYDNRPYLIKDQLVDLAFFDEKDESEESLNARRAKGGTNIILYGVPGAGKSWTIKNEYCDDESRMERLVFHPDYTYSDFVGQILPKVSDDGSVSYEFSAGPFTKLVRKAYINPDKMYYLIIEEVNRGNAPAIFGDVFQLLDRNKDGSSEYEITNADIAKIVYLNDSHKVSIPSNMCILCTMNTSDQNVFTLDTAFQRRWSMRLIRNRFHDEEDEKRFAKTKILDTDVTWEHFFTEINNFILGKNIRMTSSEDKRLGTHFVSEDDLAMGDGSIQQISRFPEKVLKYLWDDAFKFTKEDVFDLEKVKSLEDVIDLFVTSKGNSRFLVFKENIYNSLVPKGNS